MCLLLVSASLLVVTHEHDTLDALEVAIIFVGARKRPVVADMPRHLWDVLGLGLVQEPSGLGRLPDVEGTDDLLSGGHAPQDGQVAAAARVGCHAVGGFSVVEYAARRETCKGRSTLNK